MKTPLKSSHLFFYRGYICPTTVASQNFASISSHINFFMLVIGLYHFSTTAMYHHHHAFIPQTVHNPLAIILTSKCPAVCT